MATKFVAYNDATWGVYIDKFYQEYISGLWWHDIQAAIDGKANFLAALGLVSYTEILGALSQGTLRDKASANKDKFEAFFRWMGEDYETLLKKEPDLYGKLRNKLAHEYFADTIRWIAMDSHKPLSAGIILEAGNEVSIVVRKYFRDLQTGAEQYFARLGESGWSSKESENFRRCFPKGLIHVTG